MKNTKLIRIAAVIACLLVLISVFALPLSAAPIIDDSNGVANGLVTDWVYNTMVNSYTDFSTNPSYTAYEAEVNSFCADKEYTYTGYIMGLEFLAADYVDADLVEYPFDINDPDIRMHGVIDFSMVVNDLSFVVLGAEVDLYSIPSANSLGLYVSEDLGDGKTRVYTVGYSIIDTPAELGSRVPYVGRVDMIEVVDEVNGESVEYVRYDRSQIENLYFTFSNGLTNDTSSYRALLSMLGSMFMGSYKGHFVNPLDYYYGYVEGAADLPYYYEAGYQQAVTEIDSGRFGKNILGSVFSAPFEMLREFTLVEWTTSNGVEVSINLATVISAAIGVSLFIWLIKVFAGG